MSRKKISRSQFFDRIQELMGDLEQKEFCKKIEFSSSYVSQIKSGAIKPSLKFLMALLLKHNCNLNWFMTGEGPMFLEKPSEDRNLEKILDFLYTYPDFRQVFLRWADIFNHLGNRPWERKAFLEIIDSYRDHLITSQKQPK